ncbi:uncharacterized protein [Primulina eburnea]|uniref:uncharacterized protein n=1 Tax=Primulina eburnea TaxID=1245227 RepID=UPI003C6C52DC
MSISFDNSIRFIEDALWPYTTLTLVKKKIIRQHLISIFQDFPSFKPSVDTFTHNDNTKVTHLNATWELYVSQDAPSVSSTIWKNELDDGFDRLLNGIKYNDKNYVVNCEIDEFFEGLDLFVDLDVNDLAIENLLCAWDGAVGEGVVSFEVYVKQARIVAREQFFFW